MGGWNLTLVLAVLGRKCVPPSAGYPGVPDISTNYLRVRKTKSGDIVSDPQRNV